jgi:GGDEF domain-containing protein
MAIAKAWLLELLAHTALDDIATVPVALLAREAPALCDAVVEAVADDAALDRLLAGGDRAVLAARAGALTGATGPADVVAGVEALRAVLHRALRTDADAALAADTGDRLAHVCARVAAAALQAGDPAAPPPARVAEAAPPVLPPDPAGRVLVAQDLRTEAAHVGALGLALERRGDTPVAVLALELDDRERLTAVDGPAELARGLVAVEEALAVEAGADGVLVREQPGRWWLVAPRTDTDAARELAHRCSKTFTARAPVRHGVPLRASIGVAVCPDDGSGAQALADHADQGVFTARALGVPVA